MGLIGKIIRNRRFPVNKKENRGEKSYVVNAGK